MPIAPYPLPASESGTGGSPGGLPGPETITTEMLKNLAVTGAKIAGSTITTGNIAASQITPALIAVGAFGALTERATGSLLEPPSALEDCKVKAIGVTPTTTATFIQLIVEGVTVDQASSSATTAGKGHLQLEGIVQKGKKYEYHVVEGTLEPAGKVFEVRQFV